MVRICFPKTVVMLTVEVSESPRYAEILATILASRHDDNKPFTVIIPHDQVKLAIG
jgi:hypothetical protein